MHKRGLCRHSVSVCLSVCVSVTFVDCVKMNKHIFELFSPSGSKAILVFPHQTGWRYFDGNPRNGVVECRWGRQKSRFWAYIWFLPAVNAATSHVLSTGPAVDHGHRPASYDTYGWSYTAGMRVFDHQAPRAITMQSASPWFYSARPTKRALALYTITVDRESCVW